MCFYQARNVRVGALPGLKLSLLEVHFERRCKNHRKNSKALSFKLLKYFHCQSMVVFDLV